MKRSWKILNTCDLKPNDSLNAPEIIRKIFLLRGISDYNKFLNFSANDLYDPFLFESMDAAVDRILKAVKNKEKVIIYGDYDVDGVCATSILWEFLYEELKADVLPYIPSRMDEGYGLNKESITSLINENIKLVITVDCGIRDKYLIQEFKDKVDFIITDHHAFAEELPETIVIHPRHPNGNYPFGEISGGVVSWKLVTAIKQKLGLISKEDISKGIDLAAFSTVCDVMPLIDENRLIVKLGLEEIKKSSRLGLIQMINESGIKKEEIDAYHLGFVLGPRINASGRLDHALDAVRLLVTKNNKQAIMLSKKLGELNRKRQEITKEILNIAEQQIESMSSEKLLFAYGENWPEGVVGLVAGRITEKYHKPCLVASLHEDDAVGSARSISAFNIIEAIDKNKDKLIRYGGHAQAAGFTVIKSKIEDFRDSLQLLAREIISEEDLIGEIEIDVDVEFPDLNFELVDWIQKLQPFGFGNKAPVLLTRKVKVASVRTIGSENNHLKLILFKDGKEFDAIGFNMGNLIEEVKVGDFIDIVYNLDVNEWNGKKSLQLKIKDIDAVD